MTTYERLEKRLAGEPYLVVDAITGEARLVNQAGAFRLMMEAGPFPKQSILDARGSLEGFASKTPAGRDDREFGMGEIAQIAGLQYHTAYWHVRKGVLPPPIRPFCGRGTGRVEVRFTWTAAFVAGLLGTLKRQGVGLEVLAEARVRITDELLGKKRTAKRRQSAERS